jgi:signal transduction histidine kinase
VIGPALTRVRRSAASVRWRAVALATTVVGLALSLAAVALVSLQRETLRDNVDDTVRLRAADLAVLVASGDLPPELAVTDPEIALVQVVDPGGQVIAPTSNILGEPLLFDVQPGTEPLLFDSGGLPIDDEDFRVLAVEVAGPSGPRWLYVAASLEPVSESAESLVGLLRVGLPVLLVAVGFGTWFVVGHSLRPIETIRRRVEHLGLAHLDQRVPEPASNDEVGRLARTMNDLLARLEAGYRREENFIADAAHELRSPLASLRTQLDVHAMRGVPLDATDIEALAVEVNRLQVLADNLLVLDATERRHLGTPVLIDLDDLLLDEIRAVHLPSGKRIHQSAVSAAAVRGDPEALQRLVRNLLDNALKHAAQAVTISLGDDGQYARLVISDDGPGIPAGDRERVFERFVRLDSARQRGGAGLGLAICKAVVDAHQGRIRVESAPSGGASLVVELPSS